MLKCKVCLGIRARTCLGKTISGFERKDDRMLKLVLSVLLVVLDLVLIAVVMLQSGKSAGLSGAIAGGAETFLSKNKAKSLDAKLAKMTKWVAILWVVITLALCVVA